MRLILAAVVLLCLVRRSTAYYWIRGDPQTNVTCPNGFVTGVLHIVPDPDDDEKILSAKMTTRCHEYIHFLQDLNGVAYNNHIFDLIIEQDISTLVKKGDDSVWSFSFGPHITLQDGEKQVAHNGTVYFKLARGMTCDLTPGVLDLAESLITEVLPEITDHEDFGKPFSQAQMNLLRDAQYNVEKDDGTLHNCLTFYEYSAYGPHDGPQPLRWGGLIAVALVLAALPPAASAFVAAFVADPPGGFYRVLDVYKPARDMHKTPWWRCGKPKKNTPAWRIPDIPEKTPWWRCGRPKKNTPARQIQEKTPWWRQEKNSKPAPMPELHMPVYVPAPRRPRPTHPTYPVPMSGAPIHFTVA